MDEDDSVNLLAIEQHCTQRIGGIETHSVTFPGGANSHKFGHISVRDQSTATEMLASGRAQEGVLGGTPPPTNYRPRTNHFDGASRPPKLGGASRPSRSQQHTECFDRTPRHPAGHVASTFLTVRYCPHSARLLTGQIDISETTDIFDCRRRLQYGFEAATD